MSDADLSWLADELTIAAIVRRLTGEFASRGFWGPSQDARALVGKATGLDYTGLVVEGDAIAAPDQRAEIERLARRRLAYEPVGRILGSRDFLGFELEVTVDTLEPREDTEILVEQALAFLDTQSAAVIADIGTGTGAILIAILAQRQNCIGLAIDISRMALAAATRNAERHGVENRWHPVVGSYATCLAQASCHLIVSNPPYIPSSEIADLEPDVRDYDPRLALDGGSDGLDAYRALIPQAMTVLMPTGALMVEIGSTQSAVVCKLMQEAGFGHISVVPDRANRDRVVIGFRC